MMLHFHIQRVPSFGNLWIIFSELITTTYRSFSRPSSSFRAKASTIRSSLLLQFKFSSLSSLPYILTFPSLTLHPYILLLNPSYYSSSFTPVKELFQWRISDLNRWPSDCKTDALAIWANSPLISSLERIWTAGLYIISVALSPTELRDFLFI